MLQNMLFNFPFERLHLLSKSTGKQHPGSLICLLTLKSAFHYTSHVDDSDTPQQLHLQIISVLFPRRPCGKMSWPLYKNGEALVLTV